MTRRSDSIIRRTILQSDFQCEKGEEEMEIRRRDSASHGTEKIRERVRECFVREDTVRIVFP